MFTREKGTEIRRKKETGDLLGEILGPWIPPEGKKKFYIYIYIYIYILLVMSCPLTKLTRS